MANRFKKMVLIQSSINKSDLSNTNLRNLSESVKINVQNLYKNLCWLNWKTQKLLRYSLKNFGYILIEIFF